MNKVLIIAEAGINHNGDMEIAKKLIDTAADAGADYIKFQSFVTENLVSENAEKAPYQIKNTNSEESQFQMLKKLELDKEKHKELLNYTNGKNIQFLSTPFDNDSVDLLYNLGIRIFKIPSGEVTNALILEKIGALRNIEVIMSTGMCSMKEINQALSVLTKSGLSINNISVLHCNTDYPTKMQDVNLLAMNNIGRSLNVKVGYSDHTLGIEIPIAAVALGAKIIEKHITLDKNMEGPDHKSSIEPHDLKLMVKQIRNVEIALGNEEKTPTPSETKNLPIARKSLHLVQDIKKDTLLEKSHLSAKRPGNGISPMDINKVIGKTLKSDLESGQILKWDNLK